VRGLRYTVRTLGDASVDSKGACGGGWLGAIFFLFYFAIFDFFIFSFSKNRFVGACVTRPTNRFVEAGHAVTSPRNNF
jgi:hypothetical protein